jgi:hypothetical protein
MNFKSFVAQYHETGMGNPTEDFARHIFANLHPLDRWLISYNRTDDESVFEKEGEIDIEASDTSSKWMYGPYYRHLVAMHHIGGITPSFVKEAYDNGTLLRKGEKLKWAVALGLPDVQDYDNTLKGCVLIIEPFVDNGKERVELQKLRKRGVMIVNEHDLWLETIQHADIKNLHVNRLISDLGGTPKSDGWTEIRFNGSLFLQCRVTRKNGWEFRTDEVSEGQQLRKFFWISCGSKGFGVTENATAAFLVIDYLFSKYDNNQFKGALAYLPELFVEVPMTGWGDSTDEKKGMLESFLERKLGMLQLGLAGKGTAHNSTWMGFMQAGGSLSGACRWFEDAGYPVFAHKTGRYITIDEMGCTGLVRLGNVAEKCDKTILPCKLDKKHKAGGRMGLANVPTAAQVGMAKADSRILGKLPDGRSIFLDQSKFSYLDKKGEVIPYYGVKMPFVIYDCEAILSIAGSGQAAVHPEFQSQLTLAQPSPLRGEVKVESEADVVAIRLSMLPIDSVIESGKAVATHNGKPIPGLVWSSPYPGLIVDTKVSFNEETMTAHIRVKAIDTAQGGAAKIRGLGICGLKATMAQNHKLSIVDAKGNVVIDPSKPYEGQRAAIALTAAEEGKTLNAGLGLLAEAVGGIYWDTRSGLYTDHLGEVADEASNQRVTGLLKAQVETVTVTLTEVEELTYNKLKEMYSGKEGYTFSDSTNTITAVATAIVGEGVCRVETPLSHTFLGQAKVSNENLWALLLESSGLENSLLPGVERNALLSERAILMAKGEIPGATEDNPFGALWVVDENTLVKYGEKFDVLLMDQEYSPIKASSKEIKYLSELTIPEGSLEAPLVLTGELDKFIRMSGGIGLAIVSKSAKRAKLTGSEEMVNVLELDLLKRIAGAATHRSMDDLSNLLELLMTPLDDENGDPVDDRSYDGWESKMHRFNSGIKGIVEKLIVESTALMKLASQTEVCAFTYRSRGSIFIKAGESHMSKATAKYLGIRGGDTMLRGRMPMPSVGWTTVVIDDRCEFGVIYDNAPHVIMAENGDFDGDQRWALVFRDGLMVTPRKGLNNVNPVPTGSL